MKEPLPPALAEAFAWIESFTNFERRAADNLRPFRLDRMKMLAREFGDPQNSFSIIHVAGSKGKGSTCAFAGSILTAAGFRTGVYASPHVLSYRERFMLDGEYLPEELLLEVINSIRKAYRPGWFGDETDPTTFELLTLIAFIAFRKVGCKWAVLETGLGGRLDATNIVIPQVSVITSIELEHTRLLGNSIAEVAAEKGGIIKPRVPVLLGDLHPEAVSVLADIARRRNSPLYRSSDIHITATKEGGVDFQLPGGVKIEAHPGITGVHQRINASAAAMAVQLALQKPYKLDTNACIRGIEAARLPGRFEVVRNLGRDWIYDGAHTPNSVAATAETFRTRYPSGGVLVFAIAEDKNTEGVTAALPAGLSAVIVTRPGTFRVSSPEKVSKTVSQRYPGVELIPEAGKAIERALECASPGEPILVMGSFYLLGAVKEVQDF
ncbi:folylpolyglutamate synthase/dihydrofolate synthase family protein [Marispirochaeta sp.]|uniref:bifunctional folylpolyglutamate synthase/dihydrofolate synthase n=1 Tax=Marispirochaeta sp. TaxID=2038653 RepID=UPI0029C6FBBF|nr:folylpolyglutamate synthase/dihydrofolate synthase family protein [Marispirochaeta sp.]